LASAASAVKARLAAPAQPAYELFAYRRPFRMTVTRVAIAGLGAIGRALARRLAAGLPGATLAGVAARDRAKAQAWLDEQKIACPLVELDALPQYADLAIECAPAAIIEEICRPMLQAGKRVMVLSCGALLPRPHLIELAGQHGGQIIVPTGALLGLDAVAAAAEGTIHSVRMITRKPPNGLAGAPYLVRNNISVDGLNTAKRVFAGTAREAAAGFPENVNVVAALSLAGIGPDRTTIEIWADPAVTRNCHNIEVDADSARFSLAIENIPSENPKTGRITALSVLAALRKLNAPLRVGT
jgi:aspartate dehydrogenase